MLGSGPFKNYSIEQIKDTVNTNCTSHTLLTRILYPLMIGIHILIILKKINEYIYNIKLRLIYTYILYFYKY